MQLVHVYADESCLGNQYTDRDSPGGAGGLVETWRAGSCIRRDFWLSEAGTTNNRMALRGAAELLAALKRPCSIVFTSDSQYLITGMREWIHGWAARGWKRKAGPIENVELWRQLVREAARHEIDWRWVKGHAGHPQNEYVNDLAVEAAKKQNASAGLIDSSFTTWLEREREARQRYMSFFETQEPTLVFNPARKPPPG